MPDHNKKPDFNKKPRMSSFTRLGVALLVVGALTVGIGTYYDRGAISLYGLFLVIAGFVLYFATAIVSRKMRK
jgi:membrane-bound ClpP family serine protease